MYGIDKACDAMETIYNIIESKSIRGVMDGGNFKISSML
jgi:hypothetical protein